MPVRQQFTEPGWNYMTGVLDSLPGQRSARASLVNFLWHHLGLAQPEGRLIQKLRKQAFANFGKSLVEVFPNCFAWKEGILKVGASHIVITPVSTPCYMTIYYLTHKMCESVRCEMRSE